MNWKTHGLTGIVNAVYPLCFVTISSKTTESPTLLNYLILRVVVTMNKQAEFCARWRHGRFEIEGHQV